MKRCFLLMLILLASQAAAQERPKLIGEVEFFGYAGVDTDKLRKALPFHEQDRYVSETYLEQIDTAAEAVRQVSGRYPTDLVSVCCDARGNWIIFIGLAGKPVSHNSPPKGHARLPERLLELHDRFIKLNMESVKQGTADEDDSKGYALTTYPPMRSVQLEMRAYAVGHGAQIREVLKTSAEERQRIVAATLLGYARRSTAQLAALVQATRDSSDGVRNNATRALVVLAKSNPQVAGKLPAAGFVELILSEKWTDLNKGVNLLDQITKSRKRELLEELSRPEVVERLIEMARWRSSHAEPASYVLGRVAGIDESRLEKLVKSKQVEAIVKALNSN